MWLKGLGIELSSKLHHTHTLHLPFPLLSSYQDLVPRDLDGTIVSICQNWLSFLFSPLHSPEHMNPRSLDPFHNTLKRDQRTFRDQRSKNINNRKRSVFWNEIRGNIWLQWKEILNIIKRLNCLWQSLCCCSMALL